MTSCRRCHHLSYVNQHKLDTADKLRISYQTPEVITTLSYPRRYTISTNDYDRFTISIGPEYSSSSEAHIIRGEWLIGEQPSVQLNFTIEQDECFSNIVLCSRISLLLEALAFAEIALLTQYPRLSTTPVLISFLCANREFQRCEPWNTLGDWLPITYEQKKRGCC